MISASQIFKNYQQQDLTFLKKRKWTQVHTLMSIGYGLLVVLCGFCFWWFSDKLGENTECLIFTILSCITIIAIAITLAIKFYMPYFMKKAEDDKNRENKLLSLIQEEYEYNNLAEKTSIGIIEKYAKAIVEEELRNADAHRQQAVKRQEYNSKVADITCDLFKAYSSAQSPQTTSGQQMVYQFIQSLINNNK